MSWGFFKKLKQGITKLRNFGIKHPTKSKSYGDKSLSAAKSETNVKSKIPKISTEALTAKQSNNHNGISYNGKNWAPRLK